MPESWAQRALVPFALACVFGIYGTPSALRGPLLYDDKAAVLQNPVVLGLVPLSRVAQLDFWGHHEVASVASHKSWRPLVTLSYRANFAVHGEDPFGYHCVNVVLHAIVSLLVAPFASAAPAAAAPAAATAGGQTQIQL